MQEPPRFLVLINNYATLFVFLRIKRPLCRRMVIVSILVLIASIGFLNAKTLCFERGLFASVDLTLMYLGTSYRLFRVGVGRSGK